MGMTKKQAMEKIEPLKVEIGEIKKDLPHVIHPASIRVLTELIEGKERLLERYEQHAKSPSVRRKRN